MNSRNKNGDPKGDPQIEDTDEATLDSAASSEDAVDVSPVDAESTLILDAASATERPEDVIEDAELVSETAPETDLTEEVSEDAVVDEGPDLSDENDPMSPYDANAEPADYEDAVLVDAVTDPVDTGMEEAEAAAALAAAAAPVMSQAAPIPTPPIPPAPPAPPKKSGSGFIPAVLGGLVAAGLGYGVATYTDLTGAGSKEVKSALAQQGSQLSTLETRIGEIAASVAKPSSSGLEDQLTALTGQLQTRFDSMATQFDSVAKTIGDVQTKLGDLDGRVSGLDSRLGEVDAKLGAFNERLTAAEKRPLVESSETAKAAFTAYERELQDLKTSLDQQKAQSEQAAAALAASAESAATEMKQVEDRAAALQAEAEATAKAAAEAAAQTARAATVREALATLTAALERGAPYAGVITTLSDGAEVPEALAASAESGVVSLGELQDSFPAYARAALDASIPETITDDPVGRLEAFLRAQTGARSLTPQDGSDPDAVLSRAEGDLAAGDLSATLSEIAQLPQSGQDALADWVAKAKTRLAVTTAADELAKTLLAN